MMNFNRATLKTRLVCSVLLLRWTLATQGSAMDYAKLGEQYGNLSNAHDLEGIRAMIAPDATIYGNTGADSIIAGMTAFRKTFKDVTWRFTDGFKLAGSPNANLTRVSFYFVRHWRDEARGGMSCTATEYIDFTEDGLMQAIGYINGPSEPAEAPYPYPAAAKADL